MSAAGLASRGAPWGSIALAVILAAAGSLLCACLSETTFVQPPLPGSSADTTGTGGGGGGGTVQRAVLAVTVTVTGNDSLLAARIGSPGGVLREATVTIEREGSAASRRSNTTDAAGTVEFAALLPGRYQLSVVRVLTTAETAAFDSTDRDVTAFGGGLTLGVEAPLRLAAVAALAGRRGSLVISEVFDATGESNGLAYEFGRFLEIYNNSDTTIYLDGKIVGVGPQYMRDFSTAVTPISCEDAAPYQLDPEGLWSRYFWRIPGAGQSHPLTPGQAAVLATDAIDHGQLDPSLPNLASAAFEFVGSMDADNPGVPNLIQLGDEYAPPLGHGLMVGEPGRVVYYLADSLDPSTLPTAVLPGAPWTFRRVPRNKVLDVFTSLLVPDLEVGAFPVCPQVINPVFDLQEGYLLKVGTLHTNTIIRQPWAQLPDGRWVLRRTKATALDFGLVAFPTAGWVP